MTARAAPWRVLPLAAWLAASGLAHALRAALGPLDPLLTRWPRLCPLHALTGLDCPTCGLGRALANACAGDWALAFERHPLGPLLLAVAGIAALAHALQPNALRRAWQRIAGAARAHPRAVALLLAAYVAWGLARGL